jgi:hypothetical protein
MSSFRWFSNDSEAVPPALANASKGSMSHSETELAATVLQITREEVLIGLPLVVCAYLYRTVIC